MVAKWFQVFQVVQKLCILYKEYVFHVVAKCCPYNSQVMHKWCQVVSNRLPCGQKMSKKVSGIASMPIENIMFHVVIDNYAYKKHHVPCCS